MFSYGKKGQKFNKYSYELRNEVLSKYVSGRGYSEKCYFGNKLKPYYDIILVQNVSDDNRIYSQTTSTDGIYKNQPLCYNNSKEKVLSIEQIRDGLISANKRN